MKRMIPIAVAAMLAAGSANALVINTVSGPDAAQTLLGAVLAPDSGISVVGDPTFVGVTTPGSEQSATYTGFNLSPATGPGATITNPDGILLTSGHANLSTTNTANNFSNSLPQPGTGGNAALTTLSGVSTFDHTSCRSSSPSLRATTR